MAGGDIASTLFAIAVMTVAAWLFIEWMVWLADDWRRFLAGANAEPVAAQADQSRAEAIVPEFAAASRAPDYKGRCRCGACRQRPQEPCSDFDED